MVNPTVELLRWQFDLTWSLLELHLDALTDGDCLWEPAETTWTVRQGADGVWRADFAETEPDPIPAVTAGWVTWHIGWWWSAALTAVHGGDLRPAEEVPWPGSAAAAIAWLGSLRGEWITYLDGLGEAELVAVAPFPWPDGDHTITHLAAWVNAELMKNTAELGQLRVQRAARGSARGD